MLSAVNCIEKRCLRLTADQSTSERSASCCYAKRSDCSLLSNRIMTRYHCPEPFVISRSILFILLIVREERTLMVFENRTWC